MAEGEELRPDLLKNTPSNIARDVIEHSKARHKYLAQTCSSSDGGDVRWYFCKIPLAPNELAASVPRTEMVGKSDYFRFGMRDSLAIEASFLQGLHALFTGEDDTWVAWLLMLLVFLVLLVLLEMLSSLGVVTLHQILQNQPRMN